MFKFKYVAVAVLAATASAASFASLPVITLTGGSGSFAGSASTNTFSLTLSEAAANLTALVSANYLGAGYDVTAATFDGLSFNPQVNVSTPSGGFDYWTYQAASIAAGDHEIIISGNAIGGSTVGFTGSITVASTPITPPPLPAVPEPETYAMLLAGLGLMGAVARRRMMKS